MCTALDVSKNDDNVPLVGKPCTASVPDVSKESESDDNDLPPVGK